VVSLVSILPCGAPQLAWPKSLRDCGAASVAAGKGQEELFWLDYSCRAPVLADDLRDVESFDES